MNIVPIHEVTARKQQYATINSDVYAGLGYNDTDPMLRDAAQEVFRAAFGFSVHRDDIHITCTTLDGEPGKYRLVFRATWDPPMHDVELREGTFDGQIMHLPGPTGTVTMSSGVGTYEYELVGFNTTSRRYVFALKQKVPSLP